MPRHLPLLLAFAFALASCDSGEPGKLSMDEYEGPAGEALARHVLKTLPPISPEVPKVYTVVRGPHLKSTSMDFVRRMADLKLSFVSGEVLTVRGPDKLPVDPRSDTSPVIVQIEEMRIAGRDKWEALAGWAWKRTYEKHRYTITKTANGFEVKEVERIEGNYVKPD